MRIRNTWLLGISVLFFTCKSSYTVTSGAATHSEIKKATPLSSYDSVILPYRNSLNAQMSRTIATTTDVLTKEGTESTIGNFICDAMLFMYDSIPTASDKSVKPIVLMNRGGIRTNLPKGILNVGNIYELMPFDNELVLLRIKGTELKEVFKLIIAKKHAFKNASVNVKRGDTLIQHHSAPINDTLVYTLLTSDYLSNGGDSFNMLQKASKRTATAIKLRDAILSYCEWMTRQQKRIEPYTDGHFELSN